MATNNLSATPTQAARRRATAWRRSLRRAVAAVVVATCFVTSRGESAERATRLEPTLPTHSDSHTLQFMPLAAPATPIESTMPQRPRRVSSTVMQLDEALPMPARQSFVNQAPGNQPRPIQPEVISNPAMIPPALISIRGISTDIAPPVELDAAGEPLPLPENMAAAAFAAAPGFSRVVPWDAISSPPGMGFCYQPLYFEEPNAERFGRNWGIVQPFVSAAHFYGRIPFAPIMIFTQPARRCTYHAHWTLPGYYAPREPVVFANRYDTYAP